MSASVEASTVVNAKGIAAIYLVASGHAVIPCWWPLPTGRCACGSPVGDCKIGKHPIGRLVPHGVLDATTDPSIVLHWWQQYPEANIGRAAGEHELILDVDVDKGGADTLAALERQYGALPETVEAISGSGGRHLFFTLPAGVRIGNAVGFGPGLDTRAKGGYVLAAGSTHVSGGRYEWDGAHHPDDGTPVAEAPAWLLNIIRQRSPAAKAAAAPGTNVAEALSGISDGQRDVALFNLTCKLHRAGVPADWALQLVTEAAQNCTPPFSTTVAAEKVRRIYGNEPVDPLGGAGVGDPLEVLQRRVWDLEEKVRHFEERDKQRRRIIANPGIEAATKIVGIEMIERADYHHTKNGGQGGPTWIANASIAKATGLSPKCVGRHVKALADTFGVINRTLEYHQGQDRLETRQLVDLPAGGVSRAATALAYATVPDTAERRRHGGRREWCELHPDAPIRITEDRRRTCTECGEIIDEEHTERTVMRRNFRLEGVFRNRRDNTPAAPPTHHGHTGTATSTDAPESPPTQDGQAYSPRRIATQDGYTGTAVSSTPADSPPTHHGSTENTPAPRYVAWSPSGSAWEEIPDNTTEVTYACPPGLDYSMNVTTGRRMARNPVGVADPPAPAVGSLDPEVERLRADPADAEDWPPVEVYEDADDAADPDAPEDWRLPIGDPLPSTAASPWYQQAVCLTCHDPLPAGRRYYCDGCTPKATAPPLDDFDRLGVTA